MVSTGLFLALVVHGRKSASLRLFPDRSVEEGVSLAQCAL